MAKLSEARRGEARRGDATRLINYTHVRAFRSVSRNVVVVVVVGDATFEDRGARIITRMTTAPAPPPPVAPSSSPKCDGDLSSTVAVALLAFRRPRSSRMERQIRAEFSESLKNVSIEVPVAVRVGQSVALECRYDLEGESLYMLKWYKGRSEFYRFVPKELPNTRVFPVPTVDVDVHLSGANRVVLRNVRQDLAGKYRCEVSADAPSFHTQVVASTMHVVRKYLPNYGRVSKKLGACASALHLVRPAVHASTFFAKQGEFNAVFGEKMLGCGRGINCRFGETYAPSASPSRRSFLAATARYGIRGAARRSAAYR
ncbi:hypothetical protein V9T40_007472 [Parthenolecanium corni]|uniref:Ig-like domain-containing protein n=1 Tax=Parthenolecanium corni TaxID=536013 RepID=A0AAN9Y4Z5_9HEMI